MLLRQLIPALVLAMLASVQSHGMDENLGYFENGEENLYESSYFLEGLRNDVYDDGDNNETEPIDIVEEILYFLDLGNREIELTEHKDITLIVGLSGAGKTTLLQFFANDTNRLISVPTCDECEEFVLQDEGGYVGNQSLVSQTFLPHLLYNEAMDAAIYDCPGFDDNRNASVEIANSFFIKKIANHAERIRILVVATHGTLDANDRQSFPKLINNLLILMKNPSKFSSSVAIVGTSSTPGGGSNSGYLAKYYSFLGTKAVEWINETWTGVDQERALNLLDTLTQTDENGNKTKLGFFRVPVQPGYLDEIDFFVENKQFLRELVTTRLSYVPTSSEDFGNALSDSAKLVIVTLVTNITATIKEELTTFASIAEAHFVEQVNLVVSNGIVDRIELSNHLHALHAATYSICESQNVILAECIEEISTNIFSFAGDLAQATNATIKRFGDHLDLLKSAAGGLTDISPAEWPQRLKLIKTNLLAHISNSVAQLLQSEMVELTQDFNSTTVSAYQQQYQDLVSGNISDLEKFESCVAKLRDVAYDAMLCTTNQPPKICIDEITTKMNEISLQPIQEIVDALTQLGINLQFFIDSSFDTPYNPMEWLAPLETTKTSVVHFVETDISPTLYQQLFNSITPTSNHITSNLLQRVNQYIDINFKVQEITAIHGAVRNLKNNAENGLRDLSKASEYSNLILAGYLNTLNVSIPSDMNQNISAKIANAETLEILQVFEWKSIRPWIDPVLNIYTPIDNEKTWNTFLFNLFGDMTSFEIQSNGTGAFKSWWTTFGAVNIENFAQFWSKFDTTEVPTVRLGNEDLIKSIAISAEEKMASLNSLLDTVLQQDPRCPDASTQKIAAFQGGFLSLKKSMDCAKSIGANKIFLLASHTLYIDTDVQGSEFDSTSNIKLFTMSPRYFVRDSKTVDLNGLAGPTSQVGHPGGSILSIYDTTEGGHATYYSNGGSGGNGVDGQPGAPGSSGSIKSFSASSDCAAWSGGDIRIDVYPNSCNSDSSGRCHAGNSGVTRVVQ